MRSKPMSTRNPEQELDAQERAKRRGRHGESKSGSTRMQRRELSDHGVEGSKPRIPRTRQEEGGTLEVGGRQQEELACDATPWVMARWKGQLTPSMAIYDTMQSLKSPVGTNCVGYAYNLAGFLLAAGEKGNRVAMPLCRIALQSPAGAARGQADDVHNEANELLRIRDYLFGELAKKTRQPIERRCFRTITSSDSTTPTRWKCTLAVWLTVEIVSVDLPVTPEMKRMIESELSEGIWEAGLNYHWSELVGNSCWEGLDGTICGSGNL
ncbi:hypothetical protein KSP40_PGU000916 [Platanthera guangdongensis]|uniref:ATP-dependent Clp protease proteolytic subunit n=1 Tax=Platanthera guangdongensis TaxID=2320717 RepID=A0ABR2MBP8_9ASPA